jgi:hypothetical protein
VPQGARCAYFGGLGVIALPILGFSCERVVDQLNTFASNALEGAGISLIDHRPPPGAVDLGWGKLRHDRRVIGHARPCVQVVPRVTALVACYYGLDHTGAETLVRRGIDGRTRGPAEYVPAIAAHERHGTLRHWYFAALVLCGIGTLRHWYFAALVLCGIGRNSCTATAIAWAASGFSMDGGPLISVRISPAPGNKAITLA